MFLINRFSSFSVLNEAKGEMLDISIPSVQKVVKSKKAQDEFLSKSFRIEEKIDGVKISIFRTTSPYDPLDYTKNWIIAYKTFILYPFEHSKVNPRKIKKESYGNSQFAFIHKAMAKAHHRLENIPENTEFFLEYLMRKPTLTRSYSESGIHSVILLAHSPCHYEIKNGKIFSTSSEFIQYDDMAKEFCSATKFQEPPLVFDGPLVVKSEDGTSMVFNEAGITSEKLQTRYNETKSALNDAINKGGEEAITALGNLFTSYESEFGGDQIEGSVLFDAVSGKRYKFVLADQYSKEVRSAVKEKLVGSNDEQNTFFPALEEEADKIFKTLDRTSPVESILKEASKIVYTTNLDFIPHSKKTNLNKQDDLYLKLKTMVLDSKDPRSAFAVQQEVKGKSGLGFFIGKMRILTTAHFQIIQNALEKNKKGLILALVTTSKKGLPIDDRKDIIEKAFGSKVKILEAPNANFARVLEPFKTVVSTVFCGTDNESSYGTQLDEFNKRFGTSIILDVMPREDSDEEVSSTKVESAIKSGDQEAFKNLTPKQEWSYWTQLMNIFSGK